MLVYDWYDKWAKDRVMASSDEKSRSRIELKNRKKSNAREISGICTDFYIFGCNDAHASSNELCGCDPIDLNAVLTCPIDEAGMLLAGI